MERKCIMAWVTYPEKSFAVKMAECLLEKGLAAGTNIWGPVISAYRWKGGIKKHDEWVLCAQLPSSLFASFQKEILAAHPYETPCIVSLPIDKGCPEFLGWILENCRRDECA